MSNPKSVYYTFKVVSEVGQPLRVAAHKWDENVSDELPVTTYYVMPEGSGLSKCSCPAYRECKHFKKVLEAMSDGKIDELWFWLWHEKTGWKKLDDIKPVDEWEL